MMVTQCVPQQTVAHGLLKMKSDVPNSGRASEEGVMNSPSLVSLYQVLGTVHRNAYRTPQSVHFHRIPGLTFVIVYICLQLQ
jgi:hypothetical protein